MDEPTRREDLEVLGVAAGAGPTEVARAYRELRDLYAEGSLASYALCSPEERRALLARIEDAHRRLAGGPAATAAAEAQAAAAPPPPPPPAADPAGAPGAYLRQCREARGLSLRDVAEETRISARHLEHIEAQAFGQLPVRVYLRGFLVAYARALRLDDPKKTAELYLQRLDAECAEAA